MIRKTLIALAITVPVLVFVQLIAASMLVRMFHRGWIDGFGVEVGWLVVATVPGLIAWAGLFIARFRSGYWAWILLPGVLFWASRPWYYPNGGGRLLGAWGYIEGYGQMAWTATMTGTALAPNAIAGIVGLLVIMTLCAIMTGQSIRQTKKHLRNLTRDTGQGANSGSGGGGLPQATWATERQVRDRFSHPGGIVLGEMTDPVRQSPKFTPSNRRTWKRQGKGRLLAMNPTDGNGHVLVTSQASGYKSTGIVIPNILNYNGPLVVFDPKCELYARTAAARRKMGFNPVVIDASNGYDPAKLIALLARDHPSAYHTMAQMMIPREYGGVENGKFFKDAATALFTGLLGYYAETGSTNIVGDIAQTLSMSPGKIHDHVAENLANTKYEFIINRLNDLEDMESRFFHSIKTEITNNLLFAEFPDIQRYATMPPDSPLLVQLLDPRTDIFLNIPQHVADGFAPMLRLMLGSFLAAAQLTEVNEAPRARRLFIIDEAAKLGNMDILENIRDRGRSIGLHLMVFYQTPGAVSRIWGRDGMNSWRDGCSATVMGPVSARESAEALSAMLGSRTVRVTTEGSSSQHQVMSPMAGSIGSSESEQLRDVPLISPTLISQLPRHASVITAPACKPVLASKAIWFTRPDMQTRVRTTQQITADLEVAATQRRLLARIEEQKAGKTDKAAQPVNTAGPQVSAGQTAAISDGALFGDIPAPTADLPEIAHVTPQARQTPETVADDHGAGETGDMPEQMTLLAQMDAPTGIDGDHAHSTDQAADQAHDVQETDNAGGNGDNPDDDNDPDDEDPDDDNDPDGCGQDADGNSQGGQSGQSGQDGSGTPSPAEPQTQSASRPDHSPAPKPRRSALHRQQHPQSPRERELRAMWSDLDVNVRDIPFEGLVFARVPQHVPTLLRPLYNAWASWMTPRPGVPLNIRPDTGQRIPHPREARDGLALIRILDRIDWYLSHPDGRYELYDLKLRRRRHDGLEWRLHKLKCWIRNEPHGLPPGLQPSTDYPDHATLRARISPATAGFIPGPRRYDPVGNAVAGRWPAPDEAFCEAADREVFEVGPIPREHPPQLVFEHIPAVSPPDIHDNAAFARWVHESTLEKYFVDGLLRHRALPNRWQMPFFDAWPEIPGKRAGMITIPLTGANIALNAWDCCTWIDRVGEEWRLFRQAVWGENNYPLGAALSWPITGDNLKWLDRPLTAAP